MEACSHRPSSFPPSSTNSSTRQSWEYTSSGETQLVTRETTRNSLAMAQTFNANLVMRAIKSYRNSKDFCPEKLRHIKHE